MLEDQPRHAWISSATFSAVSGAACIGAGSSTIPNELSGKTLFLVRKPSNAGVDDFLRSQREAPFSYELVGASREAPVSVNSHVADHNRARLGEGEETFSRAVEALRGWRMFDVGWVRLCWPDAPVEVGTTVAVLGRHYGFWSLGACRIVYLVEEENDVRRSGFAYGTLPEHAESGEERFTVELREDGSVWYDLYAFSRPNHVLAKLGYPFARRLQWRFAQDSMRAMTRAAGSP